MYNFDRRVLPTWWWLVVGLMGLLYSRGTCFGRSSGGVLDHLCVDSSRVCSFASFESVDGEIRVPRS